MRAPRPMLLSRPFVCSAVVLLPLLGCGDEPLVTSLPPPDAPPCAPAPAPLSVQRAPLIAVAAGACQAVQVRADHVQAVFVDVDGRHLGGVSMHAGRPMTQTVIARGDDGVVRRGLYRLTQQGCVEMAARLSFDPERCVETSAAAPVWVGGSHVRFAGGDGSARDVAVAVAVAVDFDGDGDADQRIVREPQNDGTLVEVDAVIAPGADTRVTTQIFDEQGRLQTQHSCFDGAGGAYEEGFIRAFADDGATAQTHVFFVGNALETFNGRGQRTSYDGVDDVAESAYDDDGLFVGGSSSSDDLSISYVDGMQQINRDAGAFLLTHRFGAADFLLAEVESPSDATAVRPVGSYVDGCADVDVDSDSFVAEPALDRWPISSAQPFETWSR